MEREKNKNLLKVFFIFLVLAFGVYSPELGGSFIFDDKAVLQNAEQIGSVKHYFETLPRKIRNRDSYTFWIFFLTEYNLFKNNPVGYNLVNLFFHVFSAFILFLFVRKLVEIKLSDYLSNLGEQKGKKKSKNKQKEPGKFAEKFAFFVALLFLVNPVNTEAISYISGMNNGIGGFFFILGGFLFLNFLEQKQAKSRLLWLFFSIFSFVWAFFFKEVYIVFPFFCVLLYLLVNSFGKKNLIKAAAFTFIFTLLFSLGVVFLKISPFPLVKRAAVKYSRQFSQKTIATNIYANAYAVYLNVFPKNLNLDHDLPLIEKVYDIRVILSVAFLIGLLFVFYMFRKKMPLSLFAYLSYLLLMAPSNSFFLRGMEWGYDILSERNLYVPAFFFSIIIAEVIWVLAKGDLKKFKTFMLIVVFLFGARTFARNFDFKNEYTVWKSAVTLSPERPRPNYNMAVQLKEQGRLNEAIPYAQKAFRLYPKENTLGLLASLYKQSGQTESFEILLENAVAKKEFQTPLIYHQLGEFYYQKGDFEKAEKYLKKSIRKKKTFVLPRLSLTYLYLNEGMYEKAYKQLKVLKRFFLSRKGKKVWKILIDDIIASRIYFADALYAFGTGHEKQGVESCLKAIELNPKFTEPYLKLGEYYFQQGNIDKALFYFKKAETTPDYGKYKNAVERYLSEIESAKAKK